jgi:hypothetical protein
MVDMTNPTTLYFEASELGLPAGVWLDRITVEGVEAHWVSYELDDDRDLLWANYETNRGVKVTVYND